ncbi:hypothetical protein HanPI659440_Chr14g0572791 [Helianthus annuus]|nr:hypothetical protein HanPI659440_Chr14g0572791 [Helianthus annuus]
MVISVLVSCRMSSLGRLRLVIVGVFMYNVGLMFDATFYFYFYFDDVNFVAKKKKKKKIKKKKWKNYIFWLQIMPKLFSWEQDLYILSHQFLKQQ